MIRRFNYTDRQGIPRSNLLFRWIEPEIKNGPVSFEAELDLELERSLPPSGQVIVEAYSGARTMRFDFGTVGEITEPENRELGGFPPGAEPRFRVKVVDPDDPRRVLLARADAISPLAPDEHAGKRQSILPVRCVDLKDEVWRLDLDEIDAPVLLLNSQIQEPRAITAMANEGDFLALAYPSIVRQMLSAVVDPDRAADEKHPWRTFGARFAGRHQPQPDDYDDDAYIEASKEWVDDAVAGFCAHNEARREFVSFRSNHADQND